MRRLRPEAIVSLLAVVLLSGCSDGGGDFVHNRSIAELNQKARQMMEAGDYAGAVSRLEAARDLEPKNVKTAYNLAIAYQMKGDNEKAIQTFTELVGKPGLDQAEIHKALGISYEAVADGLLGQVREAQEAKPPISPDEAHKMTADAVAHYQQAIEHYQQALPGLRQKEEVSMQIEALKKKVADPEGLLTP